MVLHDRSLYNGINAQLERLPHLTMIGADNPLAQWGSANLSPSNPTTTGSYPSTPQIYAPSYNPSPAPSGGSSGDGGGSNDNPVPSIDPLTAQIEEAYNAVIGGLDSAANNLRSQLPGVEGDIRSEANVNKKAVESQKGIAERQISSEEEKGGNRKEDALTQARRLYNELTTGGQQRFGGASSAGEAFSALTGRELQRNFASIGQNYQEFMGQIADARFKVQEQAKQSLLEIDQKASAMLNQARRDFQDKLSQIDIMKAGAAENKALRKLEALQSYRNQLFQVNLSKQQQQSYVNSLSDYANKQIDGYEQQISAATGGVQNAGTDFGTNAQSTAGQFSTYGGTLDTGLQANAPTGAIQGPNTGVRKSWEEDRLFGNLSL